jgi:hypothetical protein
MVCDATRGFNGHRKFQRWHSLVDSPLVRGGAVRDSSDAPVRRRPATPTREAIQSMSLVRLRSPSDARPLPGVRDDTESHRGQGMMRRLLTILSILSFVLCVATCVLWVRSFWLADLYSAVERSSKQHLVVQSYMGRFYFEYARGRAFRMSAYGFSTSSIDDSDRMSLTILAFKFKSEDVGGDTMIYDAIVPYWFICLATASPSLFIWRRRRGKRSPAVCRVCGYDLCATPDRCPECGAVPAAWVDA